MKITKGQLKKIIREVLLVEAPMSAGPKILPRFNRNKPTATSTVAPPPATVEEDDYSPIEKEEMLKIAFDRTCGTREQLADWIQAWSDDVGDEIWYVHEPWERDEAFCRWLTMQHPEWDELVGDDRLTARDCTAQEFIWTLVVDNFKSVFDEVLGGQRK